MKKLSLTCIIFICTVFSVYCADATILREVSVSHYPVEKRSIQVVVINYVIPYSEDIIKKQEESL